MTWWKASSVTVTAGQSTVTVNTGDDIGMIKGAEGLVIGNQPPVEIKRSYLNASVMMLELMAPWPYANQSGQPAIAFPTDGDLAAATAVLKQLINGFTIATEDQMQQAIDNVNAVSALRVKQAIDFHTKSFYKQSNIIGLVSQYGGVPNGAIIERGSNAIGTYTKFADGTLLCAIKLSDRILTPQTYNSYPLSYPAEFIDTSYFLTGAINGGLGSTNDWLTMAVEPNGTTACNVVFLTLTPNHTPTVSVFAIGRWF